METSNINDLFIQAARQKLRFASPKGMLTTEDLFDLPLKGLDSLALGFDRAIREAPTKSFLEGESNKDDSLTKHLQLALDVVLYVIGVKQAEAKKAKDLSAKAEKRQRLLEILSKKENQALEGSSTEDIKKMLEELG